MGIAIHWLELGFFIYLQFLPCRYQNRLGLPLTPFFWAFTVASLVAAFLGPRVGKAIDRLGVRKVLPLGATPLFWG
jgi:hypothetical protein